MLQAGRRVGFANMRDSYSNKYEDYSSDFITFFVRFFFLDKKGHWIWVNYSSMVG